MNSKLPESPEKVKQNSSTKDINKCPYYIDRSMKKYKSDFNISTIQVSDLFYSNNNTVNRSSSSTL